MAKKKNKDKLEDYVEQADRQEVIDLYFEYAMQDYEDGLAIAFLYEQLEYMEEQELYLPCAGILKAINHIKKYSIKNDDV